MSTSVSAISSVISSSGPFKAVYLAERKIEEDGPETVAKKLRFVHDPQNDEIQVELWEADHPESDKGMRCLPTSKPCRSLGSQVWFEYNGTPIPYRALPFYIRKKMKSIIQSAELSFSRSVHGEISQVFVRIE